MAPVVVAAVVGAAASTAVGVAVGTVAAAAALSTFVTTAVAGVVLGTVATALAPKPRFSAPSANLPGGSGSPLSARESSLGIDQTVSLRQPIASHRVIYGKTRVGGTITFLASHTANRYLVLHIAIAGHEINSIDEVYFDETQLDLIYYPERDPPRGRYGTFQNQFGNPDLQFLLGSDDQTASSIGGVLQGEMGLTSEHRLRGIAYCAVELNYRQEYFPTGIPNVTFLVRGKKVYDPRTGSTVYSANPALCLADYLTNTRYGLGVSYANEIDEAALIAAANICDENINLAEGGTEKRYECHGVLESSDTPESIINRILSAMAGKLVYSSGKWRIIAGAYINPTLTFDENDLRGGITVQTLVSRRENFNAVKGVFSSVKDKYIVTDFPAIVSNAFLAEDNNERVFKSIELGMTTSASMAQRIAKIDLLRARQQLTVQLPLKLQGLKANVGDIVNITNARMGWNEKPFEVTNLTMIFSETLGVDMELREIASSVYDWTTDEEQPYDAAPNTNLPSPFEVTVPGILISDRFALVNQQIASILTVEVTGETFFFDSFEVQARKAGDTNWTNLGRTSANIFELFFVEDGQTYEVRARNVNLIGGKSEFATGSHQVVGQSEPPDNVTDLSINIIGTSAYLTWTPVANADLSHYIVRHARETSGAIYSQAMTIADKIARPANSAVVPAMTGTYFVKAVDKSGIESVIPATSVAIIDAIPNINLVETITESPTFAGSKTNVANYDGSLILDSSVLFDEVSGLFDDAEGLFDFAGGGFYLTGTYDFANSVDLGAVYTSRVTAIVTLGRIDVVNSFDSAAGLFDDREGLFDGDAANIGDVNVELYVSTTEDNPAGAPTWTDYRRFVVGDYKARAFRFRAILTSTTINTTPQLNTLQVTVDMPERLSSGDDIASGTDAGGKVVTFTKAFKATPVISVVTENAQTGDFYEIVSKSPQGFTIRYKDSGGNVVNRTFDYTAYGYGEFISA